MASLEEDGRQVELAGDAVSKGRGFAFGVLQPNLLVLPVVPGVWQEAMLPFNVALTDK